MKILTEIINFLERSSNLIKEVRDEKDLQKIISMNIGAITGKIMCVENMPCMEIDIFKDGEGVEVKLNRRFYEGFCQAYAIRAIFKEIKTAVLHVKNGVSQEEINAISLLAKELDIPTVVFDMLNGKVVYYYNPKEQKFLENF